MQHLCCCCLQDDTRVTWRALVSWAIDTRLLGPFNATRCFFRTEVRPADGGLLLIDYTSAIDVRSTSHLRRLDMPAAHGKALNATVAELAGRACGNFWNGTDFPCQVHAHFTATPNPFQVSDGRWAYLHFAQRRMAGSLL